MKGLVYILLIMPLCLNAQDKLFFKSGKTANGTLVSLSTKQVFFLHKDSIETSIIDKKEVLLIEKANGERFLIGPEKNKPAFSNADSSDTKVARHAFGIQPFGVFAGRITIAYEHFFSSNKFGVSIPLSLTFDPFGIFGISRSCACNAQFCGNRFGDFNHLARFDRETVIGFCAGQSHRRFYRIKTIDVFLFFVKRAFFREIFRVTNIERRKLNILAGVVQPSCRVIQ